MIPSIRGKVGVPVSFKGYAHDFDRAITAVQVSLDEGSTWTSYPTSNADPERLVQWTFSYTPEKEGRYTLLVRSVNDRNEVSPEAATVDFWAKC